MLDNAEPTVNHTKSSLFVHLALGPEVSDRLGCLIPHPLLARAPIQSVGTREITESVAPLLPPSVQLGLVIVIVRSSLERTGVETSALMLQWVVAESVGGITLSLGKIDGPLAPVHLLLGVVDVQNIGVLLQESRSLSQQKHGVLLARPLGIWQRMDCQ